MEGETSAATKFCSECGSQISRSARFCSECGHKLDMSAPTPNYQSKNASSNQMKKPLMGASAPVAANYATVIDDKSQSQQVVIVQQQNSSKPSLIKCSVCGIVATIRCRTCDIPLCLTHSMVVTNNNNRNVCFCQTSLRTSMSWHTELHFVVCLFVLLDVVHNDTDNDMNDTDTY